MIRLHADALGQQARVTAEHPRATYAEIPISLPFRIVDLRKRASDADYVVEVGSAVRDVTTLSPAIGWPDAGNRRSLTCAGIPPFAAGDTLIVSGDNDIERVVTERTIGPIVYLQNDLEGTYGVAGTTIQRDFHVITIPDSVVTDEGAIASDVPVFLVEWTFPGPNGLEEPVVYAEVIVVERTTSSIKVPSTNEVLEWFPYLERRVPGDRVTLMARVAVEDVEAELVSAGMDVSRWRGNPLTTRLVRSRIGLLLYEQLNEADLDGAVAERLKIEWSTLITQFRMGGARPGEQMSDGDGRTTTDRPGIGVFEKL